MSSILLIEDNPDDEALTLRALRKSNVSNKIAVVRDGEEALHYLYATGVHADRTTAALPQVVLLDLKLPKIDGLQVLRQIRADRRTALLPVVILTSSREESDLIDGYRLGCNSYVCKPVDFEAFAEAARYLGHYWLVLNETLPASRLGSAADRLRPP